MFRNTRPRELAIAASIVALAVATRYAWITGGPPVYHDEVVHAYFVHQVLETGSYSYTGWLHGPFLYYVSAATFAVTGIEIVGGRALVAAISLLMFPALWLLREDLPDAALLITGVILAVHPYVLHVASYWRQDVLLATFLLLAVGLYARYRRRKTGRLAALVGVSTGLALSTKEIGFVILPTIPLAVLVLAHFQARHGDQDVRQVAREWLEPTHAAAMVAGAVAVLVFFYGGWPPSVGGYTSVHETIIGGITYWTNAAPRSPDTFYYLDKIKLSPLVAALAVIGIAGTFLDRRSSWVRWVFLSWFGIMFIIMSHGLLTVERLIIHVFLPVTVLAGAGAYDLGRVVLELSRRLELFGMPRDGDLEDFLGGARRPTVAVVLVLVVASTAVVASGAPQESAGVTGPVDGAEEWTVGYSFAKLDVAADRADQLGCPIVTANQTGGAGRFITWYYEIANDVPYQPGDVDPDSPAVYVTAETNAALEDRGYQLANVTDDNAMGSPKWFVYYPSSPCR